MEPLIFDDLPERSVLLVDSSPIIYVLQKHDQWAARFRPLFAAQATGRLHLAVTTTTIAEVLTGPMRAGEEALVRRYRAILESWQVVSLDTEIAEGAARMRATLGLKLPDAIQVASAMAVNAAALVTHDRDFARVRSLRILS